MPTRKFLSCHSALSSFLLCFRHLILRHKAWHKNPNILTEIHRLYSTDILSSFANTIVLSIVIQSNLLVRWQTQSSCFLFDASAFFFRYSMKWKIDCNATSPEWHEIHSQNADSATLCAMLFEQQLLRCIHLNDVKPIEEIETKTKGRKKGNETNVASRRQNENVAWKTKIQFTRFRCVINFFSSRRISFSFSICLCCESMRSRLIR